MTPHPAAKSAPRSTITTAADHGQGGFSLRARRGLRDGVTLALGAVALGGFLVMGAALTAVSALDEGGR